MLQAGLIKADLQQLPVLPDIIIHYSAAVG